MKKVYVAGMYSKRKDGGEAGIVEVLYNIRRGIRVCAELLMKGYAPFCPWLDFLYSLVLQEGEAIPIDLYYEYSLAWLEVSDYMLLLDLDYPDNSGIVREVERARELDVPIFGTIRDMEIHDGRGDRG